MLLPISKGFVYVWDIEIYALARISSEEFIEAAPDCITSWRAHDSTIVTIVYIPESNGLSAQELLLTASTDKCCRLWTLSGEYIGVFGQENSWNLFRPSSFQSQINKKIKMIQQLNKRKNARLNRHDQKEKANSDVSIDWTK